MDNGLRQGGGGPSARQQDCRAGLHISTRGLDIKGERTGLRLAAATPGTFTASLEPRSVADQAPVTGVVAAVTYAVTVAAHNAHNALAALGAARSGGQPEHSPQEIRCRLLAMDAALPVVAAIGFVAAIDRALPVRVDEPVLRSLVCHTAWRIGVSGLGNALVAASGTAVAGMGDRLCARSGLSRLPIAVPAGLLLPGIGRWE